MWNENNSTFDKYLLNKEKIAIIIKKDNGEFFVTIPVLDAASKASFSKLIEKYLVPLAEEYSKLTAKFIAGYKKLFPKHLNDDADRMCHSMMFGLYAVVVEYAQRIGRIALPTEGSRCEVLIQN